MIFTPSALTVPLFRNLLLATGVLLSAPGLLQGQPSPLEQPWRWSRFGEESGLPSERIQDIVETSDGKVWVLTFNGVAWFDGFRWQPVRVPFLKANDFEYGLLSHQGNIVLLQGMQHVVKFTSSEQTLIPLPLTGDRSSPVAAHPWGGEVFLECGSDTIYSYRNGALYHIPSPLDTLGFKRPGDRFIPPRFFLRDNRQGLWLQVRDVLYRWDGAAWRSWFVSPTKFLRIHHLVENRQGRAFAVLEGQEGVVNLYERGPDEPFREVIGLEGDLVVAIALSESGEVAVLNSSGNLELRLTSGGWERVTLPASIGDPTTVAFRYNGDLLVGTRRGLYVCQRSVDRWTSWRSPKPGRSDIVNEIFHARDGTWWIGTREGILVRRSDGSVEHIPEVHGKPLRRVTGINEDEEGNIWISSGGSFEGAYRWDGKTWTHFGAEKGLPAFRIHRIMKDRQRRLWFLGLGGADINPSFSTEPGAFCLENGRFSHWGREEGLLDGRVYAMAEDSTGALWFGTFTGLQRWNKGRWTYWRSDSSEQMRRVRVFTLAVSPTNRLFFGHQWGGLGWVDDRDSLHYYTTADGLINDQVWEVKFDRAARAWVATVDGLGCLDSNRWLAFGAQTGLPFGVIWPIAFDGDNVLVGTQGAGVAILKYVPGAQTIPRIIIAPPVIHAGRTTLSWTTNAFWGEIAPALIRTQYRLDEDSWSGWTTDRRAEYDDLSYGSHRLDVRAQGLFGQIGADVTSLEFSVEPPLLLRPVFFLPLLILSVLAGTTAVSYFVRKRRFAAALRDSEAKFRAHYKGNPVPSFTWEQQDGKFVLHDYNEAALAVAGPEVAASVGRLHTDVCRDTPEVCEDIERCFRERRNMQREVRFRFRAGGEWRDMEFWYTFISPDMVLVNAVDITHRKEIARKEEETRDLLRALAGRLEAVREEERTRLSREIHDELGQTMTGLKMDLSWLRRKLHESRASVTHAIWERLEQMNLLLDETIQKVRAIATALRPGVLDDLGLVPAIEWLGRDFQERTGVRCDAVIEVENPRISRPKSTELFRILQEVLTNVTRHARATTMRIVLRETGNMLVLDMKDNGCGIPAEVLAQQTSLGLLGMEERAHRMGGVLEVDSHPGKGTRVVVHVPLDPEIT
jgi:signal transduction histidine kinase/ligand-binding sensor domain-containing protein